MPEEMKAFFDARVEGYDEHMSSLDCATFYSTVAEPLAYTSELIQVLDLGAGTGRVGVYLCTSSQREHNGG